jgi:hypothetical protein
MQPISLNYILNMQFNLLRSLLYDHAGHPVGELSNLVHGIRRRSRPDASSLTIFRFGRLLYVQDRRARAIARGHASRASRCQQTKYSEGAKTYKFMRTVLKKWLGANQKQRTKIPAREPRRPRNWRDGDNQALFVLASLSRSEFSS